MIDLAVFLREVLDGVVDAEADLAFANIDQPRVLALGIAERIGELEDLVSKALLLLAEDASMACQQVQSWLYRRPVDHKVVWAHFILDASSGFDSPHTSLTVPSIPLVTCSHTALTLARHIVRHSCVHMPAKDMRTASKSHLPFRFWVFLRRTSVISISEERLGY